MGPVTDQILRTTLADDLQRLQADPKFSLADNPNARAFLAGTFKFEPAPKSDADKSYGPTRKLNDAEQQVYARGKEIFNRDAYCITCHQPNGLGMTNISPPLVARDNPWLSDNDERLIKIVLKGLWGPLALAGQMFDPSKGVLRDRRTLWETCRAAPQGWGGPTPVISPRHSIRRRDPWMSRSRPVPKKASNIRLTIRHSICSFGYIMNSDQHPAAWGSPAIDPGRAGARRPGVARVGSMLRAGLAAIALLLATPAPAADRAKPKRIVTTFTIIQDMAQNVAGSAAVVESITKPGAEIHEYEPTPLDIVKAQSADLVLWNGMGLERWFERFFSSIRNVPSAVLSEGIEPMGIAEGPYNGKPNPHSWMSPANAATYVENIRKALGRIDPANAETYDSNAKAYTAKLKAIDAPIRAKLAEIPEAQRWLVSSEGAFSYLIRNYGMKELYLWPVNADEEGTPQQVRKVIDAVRKNRIPVVFSESTISDKPARQVAKETGARYGGVLYVDSLTDRSGPAPTYLKLLEYNAQNIVKGFFGQ